MTKILPLLAALVLGGSTLAESPVADAAQGRDLEAVRELLRAGADVNAAQNDGMSALHWAAQNDDAPRDRGTPLRRCEHRRHNPTRWIRHPCHLAGRAGNASALDALLTGGAGRGGVHHHRRHCAPLRIRGLAERGPSRFYSDMELRSTPEPPTRLTRRSCGRQPRIGATPCVCCWRPALTRR